MAVIDSKKLLPSGRPGGSIVESQKPFLVPVSNILYKKDINISQKLLKPTDKEIQGPGGNLVIIRKKVLRIKDIIKSTYLIEQSENSRQKKQKERLKFEEREKRLETKPDAKLDAKNLSKMSIPGGSILDTLNRFIAFTLAGYLFDKYNQYLPKLLEFGKYIQPITKFIDAFNKNLIDGVIKFIDLGYKAYDKTRDFVKEIGGEGAQKTFDEFSKNLNLSLNGAIAAAMLIASTAPKTPRGAAGGLGASFAKNIGVIKPRPTTGFGAGTGMTPGRYRLPGQASAGGSFQSQLARKSLSFEESVAAQRAAKQVVKQGAKQSLKSLVAVPVVGSLIGFIIDTVVFREKPTRAAAGAVGSAIGQGIGIALAGGTTFGLGAGIGMIVGGFVGDLLGKSLYDTLTGYKPEPMQGRAQGGQITSGQSSVTPSRRIKTKKVPQRRTYIAQKTQPGRDAGGKQRIESLYGRDKPGERSALRALTKSSSDLKAMKSMNGVAGGMFGAGIDMALGQKPDKKLANSLGSMFGSVVQAVVNSELNSSFNDISKTIAMANGGVVSTRELGSEMNIGEKIGRYISNAFSIALESSAAKVLQNLNQELNLKGGGPTGLDGGGGGEMYRIDAGAGGSAELRSEVAKAAAELGVPAPDLLGVILAESGGDPARTNQYGCTGLIQFCPGGGQSVVGKTGDQLRRMSIREQMPYVVKYLKAAGVKPGMSGYDIYSAVHAGRPGGNVTDRNGVTTRGFYESNVRPFIERAKRNSQVISSPPRPSGGSGSPQSVTGNLKDTGIRDYSGRPIKFKGIIADAFIDMAAAARRAGINLGSGISSSYRSLEDQKRVYREKYGANWERYMVWNSRHMSGEAFDINWDSAAGIWIRNNANRFGFGYNTYSEKSTHFDWVGGYTPNRSSTPRPPSPPSRPSSRTTRTVGGILWARNSDGSWRTLTGNPRVVSNAELNQMIIEERRRNQRASLAPNQRSREIASLKTNPSYTFIRDQVNYVLPILA